MPSGASCDPSSAHLAPAVSQGRAACGSGSRGFGAELLHCIVGYVGDPLYNHVAESCVRE